MENKWQVKIPGNQNQELIADVAERLEHLEYYRALYLKLVKKSSAKEAVECIKWLMDNVPFEDTKKIAS